MGRRLADPGVRETAFEAVASEANRFVPVYSQQTIEAALEAAERTQCRLLPQVRTEFARQGGRSEKIDILQRLIIDIVERDPSITWTAVLQELNDMAIPGGTIQDVDDEKIFFEDRRGALIDAPISGLKDRVSRAKKEVRSRKSASANSVS